VELDLLVTGAEPGATTAEFTVYLDYRETLQQLEVAIPLTVIATAE
jgi:hypothetical protein